MAHAQKPDFVFRLKGRVHLNRQGRQFSRLLAAEVWAFAVVMLDTPCSEVVCRLDDMWCVEYWLPTPFASFPFTSPSVRHRVPSHFNWILPLTPGESVFGRYLLNRSIDGRLNRSGRDGAYRGSNRGHSACLNNPRCLNILHFSFN